MKIKKKKNRWNIISCKKLQYQLDGVPSTKSKKTTTKMKRRNSGLCNTSLPSHHRILPLLPIIMSALFRFHWYSIRFHFFRPVLVCFPFSFIAILHSPLLTYIRFSFSQFSYFFLSLLLLFYSFVFSFCFPFWVVPLSCIIVVVVEAKGKRSRGEGRWLWRRGR